MFSAATKSGSAATAAPEDPYFYTVPLLLSGDGTNGAQNNTFLDSGPNTVSITRNGNTTQGSYSPYGSLWSNNFTRASSQFLTVSNAGGQFSFGTGAFVIECWVNLATMPSGASGYPANFWLFGGGPINSNPGIDFYISSTQIGFNLTDFTSPTVIGNHGISVGNWYHVAIVRGGTSNQTLSIYVNGTRVATASSISTSADAATTGIAISAAEPSGSTGGNFDGFISNYRIVKGSSVYDPTQSTITVPTTPLTAITNTQLLTCKSNRFIDNSSNALAITINGTPSVQRFSPFNPTAAYTTATIGGSGYFDGSGDYLTASYNTSNFDWYTSGTDFTLEAWIYPTTFTGWSYTDTVEFPVTVGNNVFNSTTNYWSFGTCANGLVRLAYFNGATNTVTSTAACKANQWNHIAFTKTSSGVTIFVNGVGNTATAISGTPQSSSGTPLTVGAGNNAYINGYVGDLRIVKGTAIYSGSTYTVPTAPLTAVTNTKFLANMTNAGIYDSAMMNNLETVGGAQISTSVKKYGTGSMAFDGNGDYLTTPTIPALNLGASPTWTIEFWGYVGASFGTYCPISMVQDTTNRWDIEVSAGSTNLLFNNTTATSFTNPATISTNTWFHMAFVRDGTTVKMYLNGVASATTSTSNLSSVSTSTLTYIGRNNFAGFTFDWNGYIDDLRITRGLARYTANFTPPTAALPNY